jgi:hypothetical protein
MVANKFFKKCGKVQVHGNDINNQNSIYEEIWSKLNLKDTCYHSVLNLLSSHFISKDFGSS